MASKLCDSCKKATATVYCRADSAFLCIACDSQVHAANKLASRHARVWVCEVCEQAPAHVTCKADAAALCVACDRDIHSANPLARRHERLPVTPFNDPAAASSPSSPPKSLSGNTFFIEDEAEAASWLLPNPNRGNPNVFGEMEPYMDLGCVGRKHEEDESHQDHNSSGTDGVVPVENPLVPYHGCFEVDLPSKNGVSHRSVSVSSADVGVVPEEDRGQAAMPTVSLPAGDREARVLRYREKRKSRKFEKTIRYASRKAYAETRPRVKGRFAKRVDLEMDPEIGVVPSY